MVVERRWDSTQSGTCEHRGYVLIKGGKGPSGQVGKWNMKSRILEEGQSTSIQVSRNSQGSKRR